MQSVFQHLVLEIEAYLGRFDGPGMAEVRNGLARWKNGAEKPVVTRSTDPVKWVAPACALLTAEEPALASVIQEATPHLHWITYDGYDRAHIGEAFADNHAFAYLIGGADAPILSEDFEVGLFVIAPNIFYRDHRHAAPELYAPLTGPHGWRFSPTDPLTWKAAHEPVWNEPFRPHATKTGDVPFLAVFVWTREVNAVSVIIPADDWPAMECSAPPQ